MSFVNVRITVNMSRLTNVKMADMHLAYCSVNGNARRVTRIYRNRFPNRYVPGFWSSQNLLRRLDESGTFGANGIDVSRPKEMRLRIYDKVVRHIPRHPYSSTRTIATGLKIGDHIAVANIERFSFLSISLSECSGFATRRLRSSSTIRPVFSGLRGKLKKKFSKYVLFTHESYFCHVFTLHNIQE